MGKQINNPTGKGGFQQHPELINRQGAPKKSNTFRDIYIKILEEKHIIDEKSYEFKNSNKLKMRHSPTMFQ